MTNEPRAGGLDPEMLAAYIDKRLPPDERAAVEAQLAADPDSYELLVELIHANEALKDTAPAADVVDAPKGRPEEQATVVPLVPKPARTRTWAIAGGVLAVAATIFLAVRWAPSGAAEHSIAELVAAQEGRRTVEAPLVGGNRYQEFRPSTRSAGTGTAAEDWSLLALVAEAEEAGAKGNPDHHFLGAGYLLLGRTTDAVRELRSAVELQPERADLLANYAAALLQAARESGRRADLDLALSTVDQALANQPDLREALFTRALILEGSGGDAASAWKNYLAIDSQSAWAKEAAAHLARPRG